MRKTGYGLKNTEKIPMKWMLRTVHGPSGELVAGEGAPVDQLAEIGVGAKSFGQLDESGHFPEVIGLDDTTQLEAKRQVADEGKVVEQTGKVATGAVERIGRRGGRIDGDFRAGDKRLDGWEFCPCCRIPQQAVAVQMDLLQQRPAVATEVF